MELSQTAQVIQFKSFDNAIDHGNRFEDFKVSELIRMRESPGDAPSFSSAHKPNTICGRNRMSDGIEEFRQRAVTRPVAFTVSNAAFSPPWQYRDSLPRARGCARRQARHIPRRPVFPARMSGH